MSARDGRISDWLLERLAAGELPPAQAQTLRAELREAGEEDRLAGLAASNAEILATLPPEQVVPEIERRATRRAQAEITSPRHVRRLLSLSLAATCAAGIAVFLLVRKPEGNVVPTVGAPAVEYVRLKGLPPSLRVYRKTASGSELLRADVRVRKGDTLQIRYVAAGKRWGVVASIDARGTVTFHLPETPGRAATLERDGERALAHAYELDDSPGFERFVFVTSDVPFTTSDVAQVLTSRRAFPAPLAAFAISFQKETP